MAQNFLSDIKLGDNISIRLGDATNGDLQVFHDSTKSMVRNYTGNLLIDNFANDADIIFRSDDGTGGITEYFKLLAIKIWVLIIWFSPIKCFIFSYA